MVTKEEALLDFHVTLIHKWRTEEGDRQQRETLRGIG